MPAQRIPDSAENIESEGFPSLRRFTQEEYRMIEQNAETKSEYIDGLLYTNGFRSLRLLTPDEYLMIERNAETKSEYMDGVLYAMSGASEAHGTIVYNFAVTLGSKLRGTGCRGYIADMRVQVARRTLTRKPQYFYPDLAVICGEPELTDDGWKDLLRNPILIIEVLSASTENYDRGPKFERYKKLESLQEYVLVSQRRYCVERYLRPHPQIPVETSLVKGLRVVEDDSEAEWAKTEFTGHDATITLESVGVTILLSDLYENVIPTIDKARTNSSEAE